MSHYRYPIGKYVYSDFMNGLIVSQIDRAAHTPAVTLSVSCPNNNIPNFHLHHAASSYDELMRQESWRATGKKTEKPTNQQKP